jgi:hypothetical protein
MRIFLFSLPIIILFLATSGVKAASAILINEVLPNPSGASTELGEWIELYNTSTAEVDLSGWQLDDIKDAGTRSFVIPPGTKIAPGGFLIFEKRTTGVGLNNSYDMVRLINNSAVEIDNFEYELAKEDLSFARTPDGASAWIETSPSKGSANPKPPENIAKAGSGNVILSEFSPAPAGNKEWVEIYNPNSETIDISGWKIDDIEQGSKPFSMPEGTTIKAKAYKVFYFSSKLNNSGDKVRLINPKGKLLESYSYGKVDKGTIFAKDKYGKWKITTTPTPGKKNIITGFPSISSGDLDSGSSFLQGSSTTTTGGLSDLPKILGVEDPNSVGGTDTDDRPVKTQFAGSKNTTKGNSTSTVLIGVGLIILGIAFGLPILRGQSLRAGKTNEK